MSEQTSNEYIESTASLLRQIFDEVVPEWDVARQSQDDLTPDIYRPRIDIAVGPWNTDEQIERNAEIIRTAYDTHGSLFDHLKERALNLSPYLSGEEDWHPNICQNENPRCLLAIEVERVSTDEKHKLGSIVNAASIGYVGIVVGWDQREATTLARIQAYLNFLGMHKKTIGKLNDAIIIPRSTFTELLQEVV